MAEVKPGHVYTDNLRVLEKIMGIMFNNIKFSDTVFSVKEQKFYALSQLLAASSTTLDSLITIHYENCHDKEIKLHNVKNEESFSVILQYMYGLKINFSEINVSVLCEVVTLSETYKLDDFFNDLKQYLSTINTFQLESCIVLLNTADKYIIPELRERLIIFVYQNVEEIVKHVSFKNLQYNILVDLLKTNWFCCSEIEILKGVLNWHSDMDDESKKQMNHKKEIVCDNDDIEKQDRSADALEVSKCKKDVAEIKEAETNDDNECSMNEQIDVNIGDDASTHSSIKDSIAEKNQNQSIIVVEIPDSEADIMETKDVQSNADIVFSKSENIVVIDGDIGDTISNSKDDINAANSEHDNAEIVVVIDGDTTSNSKDNMNAANSEKVDGCAKIMQSFSENIIKSLLARIRISRISALEFSRAMKTELFKKYSWIIGDENCFSQSCEPRQTYYKIIEINDVTKKFTIIEGELLQKTLYESKEEYTIGDFKWKMGLRWHQDEINKEYYYWVFLKCIPINVSYWKCTVEFNVKWIPGSKFFESMKIPGYKDYTSISLTSDYCNYVMIGEWEVLSQGLRLYNWKDHFEPGGVRTFELEIKSLKYKDNDGFTINED